MKHHEHGSALVYILIAIALLAALTITFMEPSSQQTSSQNTFKAASDIKSQVDFIQTTIQECVLYYGDQGDETARTEGFQKNAPFPIIPSSPYFDNHSVTPGSTVSNEVKHIRCPGNPGNDPNHALIFSGSSGKFMPAQPDLFGEWMYYAGDDGVFVWIETTKTDAFVQSALEKIDEDFAPCEADIIDAGSGAYDMDSDTPDIATCPNGSTCFRVWFKQKGSSQRYQEAGCP